MPVLTGQVYDPRQSQTEALPRIRRDVEAVPFTFLHSPGSWECVDLEAMGVPEDDRIGRFEWVPKLTKFSHLRGANGISDRSDGVGEALGRRRAQGWREIPQEAAPNGTSYVQVLRTAYGTRYVDCWTNFVEVGIGTYRMRVDKLGFLQWRRQLVRDGVIPAPVPEALEMYRDTVRGEIGRLGKHEHLPEVQARMAHLRSLRDGMAEAHTAADQPAARKTSRKRGS